MEYPKIFIQLPDIPEQVESASHAYEIGFSLARAGDVLGWRELVKRIRPNVFKTLVQWPQDELDGQKPESKEQMTQVVDKAVEIISPLMIVALVGVESGREQFRNQKSFLDDLLNIAGWNAAGRTTAWAHIPRALGYVYHSLHGCVSLSTNQIDLALSLARVKVPDVYNRKKLVQVWEISNFVGWADSFGPDCTKGWEYLASAFERWKWLRFTFGDDPKEYRASLVAYYMALNIHELATIIASDQQDRLNRSYNTTFDFNVPLTFMTEDQDIYERATSLLRRNPDTVAELWTELNVTHEQMQNSWRNWVHLFQSWLGDVYRSSSVNVSRQTYSRNIIYHQDFFETLHR